MGIRDKDRRSPGGGQLPDRPAGTRDGEVGRGERGAELGGRGDEDVVVAIHTRAEPLVVALAGDVQDRRARVAVRLDREVVQAPRPRECAEERDHRPVGRQPEAAASLRRRDASVLGGDGASRDAVLPVPSARQVVGQEDAPCERRRQPVGEAEVRVGLGQRRRDLAPPRGVDHRPRHIATAAEDDVRTAALQDRGTGTGRAPGTEQGAQERDGRTAGEAGDLERVELVARLGDEPSLDAIRRPGERHRGAAGAQCCCDRQRREHVPGCSAGGDQAPKLAGGHGHRPRC